jgi:hypothetical protein
MELLKHEIRKAILLFRGLIYDNTQLYNSIDENYECILMEELKWIPDSVCKNLTEMLQYYYAFINCIDFVKLRDSLAALPDSNVELNLLDIVPAAIKVADIPKKSKAQVNNFVTKLNPIINCASEIINHPGNYINKYVEKDSNNFL